VTSTKDQLHYLLHQKRMLEIPGSVLETIARIDGAIVLSQDAQLLAFGAILRHRDLSELHPENIEGGRTTAAIAASEFGNVLKISEDGLISFFQKGKCVWDV
jgi:DNA integrity scanning protein DisA with diadenylate cyclase activity